MDTPTYYIYVLSSTVYNKHYVGMSEVPVARLKQHNASHSKFTKGHRRWKIVYTKYAGDRENTVATL